MAAHAPSLTLSPRTARLAIAGCTVAILLYLAVSIIAGGLDRDGQIADLEASYAAVVGQGSGTTGSGSPGSAPGPQRSLIAAGKEAAISLIQHSLQRSVEPPAKLESLHILDGPDEKGLIVVRASIRVRNLMPEEVAAFVRRIEGSVPGIIFDDLRVSIHTRPGVFGSAGSGAGMETNSAEISGVVRTYATNTADRLPPGTAGSHP